MVSAAVFAWLATPVGAGPADPPAQDNPPPRAERREFDPATGQWTRVAPPVSGTDDGDLRIARALIARQDFDAARKAFKNWRKKYPDSPHMAEGLFYSADTELSAAQAGASTDLWQAYKWYEQILDGYAGSEWADRSLRRELLVAEMFLYKKIKRKIWGGVLRVPATDEAIEMLNRLIDERAPGTRIAEQALRLKGDYFFGAGEFEDAEDAYSRLAREFPRSRSERLALRRSADAAFASFPGVRFEDTSLLNADERYRRYEDLYPDAAAAEAVPQKLTRIRESRAEKEYLTGEYYERTVARNAALYYYRFASKTWPDTVYGGRALAKLEKLTGGATEPAPATAPARLPANAESPRNSAVR